MVLVWTGVERGDGLQWCWTIDDGPRDVACGIRGECVRGMWCVNGAHGCTGCVLLFVWYLVGTESRDDLGSILQLQYCSLSFYFHHPKA